MNKKTICPAGHIDVAFIQDKDNSYLYCFICGKRYYAIKRQDILGNK